MRPERVSEEGAAELLQLAADQVRQGASMEGHVAWEWAMPTAGQDGRELWVQGVVRTGNDMGQGGVVLVGDTSGEPQPPGSAWQALRDLSDAVHRHAHCDDCGGTGWLPGDPRPQRCLCLSALLDAQAAARATLERAAAYQRWLSDHEINVAGGPG